MQVVAEHIDRILPVALTGSVAKIVGLTVSVAGFPAPLGSTCRIQHGSGNSIQADVIGFHGDETLLLPYSQLAGVRRGNRVTLTRSVPGVRVGDRLLGRVINGHGRCLDGKPEPTLPHRVDLNPDPVSPLKRPPIDSVLGTGIRAIDGFLSCGMGQRLGIFSASGVGKSILLGQISRYSSADVNVVVLVGERGREVREFIERELGPEGLARSVVVVATSDEPALLRLRAAYLGTAVAEYFRDQGRNVLLMMDSVTRVALALREIGLAAGEPPATRGYPPSVFSALPRLLERSGRTERGSITGLYTVLVEADDPNEPVSDAVRGILDGHIFLSRRLAEQAHWPAIDVLASISRSMNSVVTAEHRSAADEVKRLLAAYDRSADLIDIGAYQAGSNLTVDTAIWMKDALNAFQRQPPNEHVAFDDVRHQLQQLHELSHAFQVPIDATASHGAGVGTGVSAATPVTE
jgi:flagellum-specific ATP synthase